MTMKFRMGMAALVPVALGACAEGIEPPATTEMVNITTGLTFEFGIEEPCLSGQDRVCAANTTLPVMYPKVTLELEPFAIDVHEVTNFQYEYCVAAGACVEPLAANAVHNSQQLYYGEVEFRNFPVVNISYEEAEDYCAFVGKRLPTEAEWERVAKGPGTPREFPVTVDVGETFDDPTDCGQRLTAIGCGLTTTMEQVGVTTIDFVEENGQRIFQLAANAAEWTDSWAPADWNCLPNTPEPCQLPGDCAKVQDDPATPDVNEQTVCYQRSSQCPDCPTETEGCAYMCTTEDDDDPEPGRAFICVGREDTTFDAKTYFPTSGPGKVIRGGDAATSATQLCRLHSWSRDFRLDITQRQPSVGFRCAKTLPQN